MTKSKLFLSTLLWVLFGFSGLAAADGDAQAGEKVYDLWCAICHEGGPDEGYAGSQMLAQSRGEANAIIKDNDALTPAYIEIVVRKGLAMMPVFRKTEITDDQLEDLTAYLLSDL